MTAPDTMSAGINRERTEMSVIKRDGSKVVFASSAILNAILNAMKDTSSVDQDIATRITEELTEKYSGKSEVLITDIQNEVEYKLMCSSRKDAARAYIEYRQDRDRAREVSSELVNSLQGLMSGTDKDIIDENANKDGNTIPTKRDLMAGIVSKHYALNHILSKEVATAHLKGDLHYHDLDYSPFGSYYNCMLINIKGMLENGFRLGNAEIVTPKSVTTAAAVISQIIAQVSSHIYGGNTVNAIDTTLEPYVEMSYKKHLAVAEEWDIPNKDEYALARTDKEVYDAMQGLEYEVNTLHTANG